MGKSRPSGYDGTFLIINGDRYSERGRSLCVRRRAPPLENCRIAVSCARSHVEARLTTIAPVSQPRVSERFAMLFRTTEFAPSRNTRRRNVSLTRPGISQRRRNDYVRRLAIATGEFIVACTRGRIGRVTFSTRTCSESRGKIILPLDTGCIRRNSSGKSVSTVEWTAHSYRGRPMTRSKHRDLLSRMPLSVTRYFRRKGCRRNKKKGRERVKHTLLK